MSNASESSGPDSDGPPVEQPAAAFSSSASACETLHAPLARTTEAPERPSLSAASQASAVLAALSNRDAPYTCRLTLKLAFFFDGTGNNLDADRPTDEHSNIARLFLAHPDGLELSGIYRFYIPGLGTYFRDIGDIGDDDGMAFGKYGDERLDKAMEWLKQAIGKHPADKIIEIRISVFGFSRGATLARAFVRRVQDECSRKRGGLFHWKSVDKPCTVYFLGLFDTVASVGLPASTSYLSYQIATSKVPLKDGLAKRREGSSGLKKISFGPQPGADPTTSAFDGHMGWARNLRIPPIVERTVHLMSMHELRNSFPLDTVWDGETLPPGATEYAYPGVHSNVGGGYRPGEGGKSLEPELLLSKIPLRKMYDEAVANGVPLLPLSNPRVSGDFLYSPELAKRFNSVLATANWRHGRLGDALLSHGELWLRWRFRAIHRKLRNREKQAIAEAEGRFRSDAEGDQARHREGLIAEVKRLESSPERVAAQQDMQRKRDAWMQAEQRDPGTLHEEERQAYMNAKANFEQVSDPYYRARGRLRTLPSYEGELPGHLDVYDEALMEDVQTLLKLRGEMKQPLRPHYQRLVDAYLDEFERQRGLDDERDKLVIDFFDQFVHDSLAGFAKDATLPSDPRCCYIGGDEELKYADLRIAKDVVLA